MVPYLQRPGGTFADPGTQQALALLAGSGEEVWLRPPRGWEEALLLPSEEAQAVPQLRTFPGKEA